MNDIFNQKLGFDGRPETLTGIATDIAPVTPSDLVDLPEMAAGLYIEGAGAVTFLSARGVQRTVNVPANHTLNVGATRVLATGTTATGIHALFA